MFINLKKKLKSKSNGLRHKKQINKSLLCKTNNLIKNIKTTILQNSGRNNTGRITVRHKGGSSIKKKNFATEQPQKESTSIAICINTDSNKTGFIVLNFNLESKKFWSTYASRNTCSGALTKNTKISQEYFSSFYGFLSNFPTGINVFNVSSKNNKYCYAKSAGTFCTLLQKQKNQFLIRLPSGKITSLPINSSGTIGKVSNKLHQRIYIGKAGTNRLMGKRPSVRGIAMNPVDHPHGGRTNGGVHPKTPWGIPTRGKHTVKKKNYVKI